MSLQQRMRERMALVGVNQTTLAEAVGLTQPAISALLTRNKTGSKHLHLIARALETTPEYLSGEVDDPKAGAAPTPELSLGERSWVEVWRAMSTGQRKLMMQLATEIISPEREKSDA